MAEHTVLFTTPKRTIELGNADVEFRVKKGNRVFGTLLVSKGGIEWRPTKSKSKGQRRKSWQQFHEMMDGEAEKRKQS